MWLREFKLLREVETTEHILLESSHTFIHDWTHKFSIGIVGQRQKSQAEREKLPVCFEGNGAKE